MTKPFVFTDAHLNNIEFKNDEVIFKFFAKEDETTKRFVKIHTSTDTAEYLRDWLNVGVKDED